MHKETPPSKDGHYPQKKSVGVPSLGGVTVLKNEGKVFALIFFFALTSKLFYIILDLMCSENEKSFQMIQERKIDKKNEDK